MKDLTVRLQQKLADGTLHTEEWRHVVSIEKVNDVWRFLTDDDVSWVLASTIAHLDVFANL